MTSQATFPDLARLTLMKEVRTMREFTFSNTAEWVVGVLLLGVTIAGWMVSLFA